MKQIQVGKLTRIITVDERIFIGTLTGYAEVSQGEDKLEEIYLSGCGEHLTTIQLNNIREIDQDRVSFEFHQSRSDER